VDFGTVLDKLSESSIFLGFVSYFHFSFHFLATMRAHFKPNKHAKPAIRVDAFMAEELDSEDHQDYSAISVIPYDPLDDDFNFHSTDYLFQVLRDIFPSASVSLVEGVWLRHRPNLDSAVHQLLIDTNEIGECALRGADRESMASEVGAAELPSSDCWPNLHSDDMEFSDDWSSLDDRWTSIPSDHSHSSRPAEEVASQNSFGSWCSTSPR
jgi:hypothetical protein